MELSLFAALQLAHPAWLWLLVPVLLIGAGWYLRPRRSVAQAGHLPGYSRAGQGRYRHPRFALLIEALAREPQSARPLHAAWRLAVLACLVLALAQPERIGPKLPEPAQRRDIVFIVDNSVAMNLRDYVLDRQRVERLAVLKGMLHRFVNKLPGERISVVLYADRAYTLVPLTYDHGLVHAMLNRIDTGLAGRSNAVGDAVALAVKEASEAPDRRRILVLFSSAARPTGTIGPLDAARLAAQHQLQLYTVAIGAGNAEAEERRRSGLIYDPADVAQLQSMAHITGARSYLTTDTRELATAIEAIAQTEQKPAQQQPRYAREPLFQWPLLAGLGLLSLAQLGSLTGWRRWT